MTNEQFWKELDDIAAKGTSGENVFAFAAVLVKGYCEGLNLFEIGMFDKDNDEMIRQLYSGDFNNRLMHCSTAFEKGQQTVIEMDKRGVLPPETKVCVTDISCKQILDNLYFKKEHLAERNDIIMGYYTLHLLEDMRWDDAEQALMGYEDTEDDTLIERFEWLKNRG